VKQEVEPSILQDIIKPACEKFAKQYKSTFKKEFEQDGLLKTEEIAEGKNSK
jgi:ribosomal protein S17E|tara:strand:- start:172 stop:327 length:156 start_codon:yes stop_codon:yes gene_type:complete